MKCNTSELLEAFCRCPVVECFSGPIVERLNDGLQVGVVEVSQVGFLREVLTDESVGVFVGASLPRTVGIGEVDVGLEEFFKVFESGKFFSVVEGECADEARGHSSEGVLDGLVDGAGFEVRDGCRQEDARLAFDEGDEPSFVVRAVHGVAFPMPGTEARVDGSRSLGDTHTPRNESSFLMRVAAALAFSVPLPKRFVEIALGAFIRVNKGVNAFMRNAHRRVARKISAQRVRDLFGRPFLAQLGGDEFAQRRARRKERGPPRPFAIAYVALLCVNSIIFIMIIGVTLQFARERARTPIEFAGHGANRRAALPQQFDMVAFEWGKMSVRHRDSSGGLDVSEHSSYRKGHDAFFTASFLSTERSRSGTTNRNGDAHVPPEPSVAAHQ